MTTPAPRTRQNWELFVLGILWFVLGGAILYMQFSRPPIIEIEWVTETEFDTAGFNIYRSTTPEGEFVQINPQLIPGAADPASGDEYVYADSDVQAGETYYYKLEDVEYSGARQQHEVIAGQAPRAEEWALILAAISFVLGIALLATGIRSWR
jgi:hypothetical protein